MRSFKRFSLELSGGSHVDSQVRLDPTDLAECIDVQENAAH